MIPANALGAEYVRIVLSRWRLVLGLVLGATLAAWAVTTFVLAQRPKFEASSRLNIVPTSEELGYANRFVRGSTFDGGSTLLQTYAEFAHTRPVVAPIVDRWIADQARAAGQDVDTWVRANSVPSFFAPARIIALLNYGEAPAAPLRDDLIDDLIQHTTIETVEGTYLLRITVEYEDPKSAAFFANALADAIVARAQTMASKSGTEIASNLQVALAGKQAQLAAVLRRSRDMKQSVGVVDIDRQKQSLLEAQIAEQSQLTSDRATLQASQSQVAGLRRQSSGKMSTAQAAIDQTLATEGPKAAGIARGIAIREGRVAQIRGQIAALGRSEDTIRSLDDQAAQLRAEVAALTERVSFSQTENLANAPRIQIIERAKPPLTRSSPKMLLNVALGFVAGCALAGLALLVLGEAPTRVREDDEAAIERAPEPEAEAPIAAPAVPPTPEAAAHPRRRWSDIAPAGRVVDMPRPTTPPPVFATAGALALARDAHEEPSPAVPVADPVVAPPAPLTAETAVGPDPETTATADGSAASTPEPVFGYLLPAPRSGRRYETREVRGIGAQVADWLGEALTGNAPLTVAAVGDVAGAQRLYQLLHDYLLAHGREVATVDWSSGARALPRVQGKPLIYAGGGFGSTTTLVHRDGDVVVAVAADEAEALEAEARRLARSAGRPVHVIPLGD